MMKLECNEGYTPTERLYQVSREIIHEYPQILIDDIMKIAVMTDVVGETADTDDVFKRYYYILWIIGRNHPIYKNVYIDMLRDCEGKLNDPINNDLLDKVQQYTNEEIDEFPAINQYYQEIE